MKTNGWEQLYCSYFSETSIAELSESMAMDGFSVVRTEAHGAVVFKRADVFIEVGYEADSSPNYSPTVVIGVGDRKYDELGRPSGVPAWFLIDGDRPERRYSFWTFASISDLRQSLGRIKADVIDVYLRPLWEDPESLDHALTSFRSRVR